MTSDASPARGFVGAPALMIATLLACDAAPRQLPAGYIVATEVIDEQSAALVTADLEHETLVLAVVDSRGAPRWTFTRPLAGLNSSLFDPLDITVVGELVLLAGHDGLVAVDRTTGALRWQAPGSELGWEVVNDQLHLHGPLTLAAIDPTTGGDRWRVLANEGLPAEHQRGPRLTALPGQYVARATDITRWARIPGPGVVMHGGSPVHASAAVEGPRERLELIHGPTGKLVWQAALTSHCQVGTTLLAATADGTLLALDLAAAAPQPRIIAAKLLIMPWRWLLRDCQQAGDTWWLRQDGYHGTSLLHGVDRNTGALKRHGLCSANVPVIAGRFALLRTPPIGPGLAAFDLERGLVTWRQAASEPLPESAWARRAGDLVYASANGDRLRRTIAFDPTTGEITGATATREALDLMPADTGPAWVFAARQTQRGPAPVVTVDRRSLRPLGPAIPGVDIVDITVQTRASLLIGPELVTTDLVWDPDTWPVSDDLEADPCRPAPSAL